MRPFSLLFCLCFLFCECRKDKELLSGDISGVISAVNEDNTQDPDQSGTQVFLYKDSMLVNETSTNYSGQYIFKDMPLGIYAIDLQRTNFVKTRSSFKVEHLGGYSPTLANFTMYEIPTFVLTIDSIKKIEGNPSRLDVILKINGDTILPYYYYEYIPYYDMIVYVSESEDVSKDNFDFQFKGFLETISGSFYDGYKKTAVKGLVVDFYLDHQVIEKGRLFFRFYPMAFGRGYEVWDYYKEALGPPSNVVTFILN
jgi:hypothetical protein